MGEGRAILVGDTGPILNFVYTGRVEVLERFLGEILVPREVRRERENYGVGFRKMREVRSGRDGWGSNLCGCGRGGRWWWRGKFLEVGHWRAWTGERRGADCELWAIATRDAEGDQSLDGRKVGCEWSADGRGSVRVRGRGGAAGEGEGEDVAILDYLTEGGAGGVDERGGGRDLDGGADFSDAERDVDGGLLLDEEFEFLLAELFEAGEFDGQVVAAGWEGGEGRLRLSLREGYARPNSMILTGIH